MNYTEIYEKAQMWQSTSNKISKDLSEYAFTFVYPPPVCLHDLNEDKLKIEDCGDCGINLYIHIPFCTGKCSYCYFCTYSVIDAPITIGDYIELLCNEIILWKEKFGAIRIASIHIGGGTPSILKNEQLKKLFQTLKDNFIIMPNIEITCETSPETLSLNKLTTLIELGVNRINIGIQVLDDKILKNIGRRHDVVKAIDAIKMTKQMGIQNINIDVMYGLPGQDLNTWINTLETILNLGVQSISAYRLRLHPNGKMAKYYEQDNNLLDMYVKMLELMDKYGYKQASSHKFAKENEFIQKQIISKRGIKNNQLLGIGLSSYGYLSDVLYWNARSIDEYKSKVDNHRIPCSIGCILDKTEQKSKACVLGLHNYKGIDLVDYQLKFNSKLDDDFYEEVSFLLKNEFAEMANSRFSLTKLGMVFADEIALMFYSKDIQKELFSIGKRYGIFFDKIV